MRNFPTANEIYSKVEPVADFNWNEFEEGIESYSKEEKADLSYKYASTISELNENEVIEGKVVDITKRSIVVNIGYKSEGVLGASEFRYNEDLKVNDMVEVYVESKEDKNGQLVLSHRKARSLTAWNKVNEALEQEIIVN